MVSITALIKTKAYKWTQADVQWKEFSIGTLPVVDGKGPTDTSLVVINEA